MAVAPRPTRDNRCNALPRGIAQSAGVFVGALAVATLVHGLVGLHTGGGQEASRWKLTAGSGLLIAAVALVAARGTARWTAAVLFAAGAISGIALIVVVESGLAAMPSGTGITGFAMVIGGLSGALPLAVELGIDAIHHHAPATRRLARPVPAHEQPEDAR